jgi:gluconolactonase
MFAAPSVIKSRVFARLPDEFRKTESISEWHRGQPFRLPVHSVLEGPSFDRRGNLYCTDIAWGRIFKITPNGNFELFVEYDGEPNGLKIHQDGRVFIADFKRGLMVLDARTRRMEPILSRVRLERLKATNVLVFASNGDIYFTDQGLTGLQEPTGRVFRLRSTGEIDCLIDNAPSPDGLVLDPTETVLYVAVTRANAIWRLPLARDGSVSKVGTFIQMSGGNGPDGLAIDEAGNLAVAHVGLGVVWLFSARGEPLARVNSCEGHHTTNVAFGGANRRKLFITESEAGVVLEADMPIASQLVYSGANA